MNWMQGIRKIFGFCAYIGTMVYAGLVFTQGNYAIFAKYSLFGLLILCVANIGDHLEGILAKIKP